MSLYYDAASILSTTDRRCGSLKSRVFGAKDLKSTPAQLFALVSEASKWSFILKEVIEKSQILAYERKLSPTLALLLVHDLLLARKGVAAAATHPLRLVIVRHKARLQAELTKARLKRGISSLEALREYVAGQNGVNDGIQTTQSESDGTRHGVPLKLMPHPRWIRINVLKTSLEEQLASTFSGYRCVETVDEIINTTLKAPNKIIHIDKHMPDLIALSPAADLSTTSAYRKGLFIFQDKASCFPAYLLDSQPKGGDCLDACAAPGNKTTHLAALIHNTNGAAQKPRIWACERDKVRAQTLQKMVDIAGADKLVTIKAGQDFLRLDPEKEPWCSVGALLLDPSCSGSGIVGRDEVHNIVLPSRETFITSTPPSRKRKRKGNTVQSAVPSHPEKKIAASDEPPDKNLRDRLESLATFQLKLLLHAFAFPQARRITYSTCSTYIQENEEVICKALGSLIARHRGWRILRRDQQVSGMQAWDIRGDIEACKVCLESSGNPAEEIAEACIRCNKGTKEGTQGFFVAAFVREMLDEEDKVLSEEEWEGFDDDK